MATELFPIIVTRDVERSLGFYRDLVGGTVTYEFPDPEGKPAYVGVDIGSSHLGIGREDAGPTGRNADLWIYVADVDAMVETMRAAGVPVLEEPRDQPWGERVAKVQDPDGTQVHVASRASDAGA